MVNATSDSVALAKGRTEPSLHFTRRVKDTTVVTVVAIASRIPTRHARLAAEFLRRNSNGNTVRDLWIHRSYDRLVGERWSVFEDGNLEITHKAWGHIDNLVVIDVIRHERRHEWTWWFLSLLPTASKNRSEETLHGSSRKVARGEQWSRECSVGANTTVTRSNRTNKLQRLTLVATFDPTKGRSFSYEVLGRATGLNGHEMVKVGLGIRQRPQ
mmetsp:Transcript_25691/g.43648  ORF Transcript_25691/g.43648 Transcript_25691/m.43648 type:complete len:214 (-) Transcript_25691:491-1132(-)